MCPKAEWHKCKKGAKEKQTLSPWRKNSETNGRSERWQRHCLLPTVCQWPSIGKGYSAEEVHAYAVQFRTSDRWTRGYSKAVQAHTCTAIPLRENMDESRARSAETNERGLSCIRSREWKVQGKQIKSGKNETEWGNFSILVFNLALCASGLTILAY